MSKTHVSISPYKRDTILFDGDEVGLWQPIANNARGNDPTLDIFTTLRSCGHVIEVEFNQTLTISQINIITSDFPDKAMGNISVTEDYRGWKQIHNGYLSGEIALSKPERARKIEIVAPLEGNLVDGVFKIYEINIWVAEETSGTNDDPPTEVNNDPLIIQQATFRLNPEEINSSTLEVYESFTLADGSTAPLVKTEDNRKHIEWRFTGSNDEKRLVSSEEFTVKSLLIELRSPTSAWGMNGDFVNAEGGVITGLNPQSTLFTVLASTTSINWYTSYSKVSKDNVELTPISGGRVDLTTINRWFWLYIELDETITDQLVLGLGSTAWSWHKLDIDVRQVLTYESSLSKEDMNTIMAHFGTSIPTPSPNPTPTPSPSPTPTEPSSYSEGGNIVLKPDSLPIGNLNQWNDFTATIPPTVVEVNSTKLVSFSEGRFLQRAYDGTNYKGFTAVIRSHSATWQRDNSGAYGIIFDQRLTINGGRGYLFEAGNTTFHSNPYPNRARKNKLELSSPYNLAPINSLFVLSVFWQESSAINHPYTIGINPEGHRIDFDLGDLIIWGETPSDTELTETEDWMMSKYQIN